MIVGRTFTTITRHKCCNYKPGDTQAGHARIGLLAHLLRIEIAVFGTQPQNNNANIFSHASVTVQLHTPETIRIQLVSNSHPRVDYWTSDKLFSSD